MWALTLCSLILVAALVVGMLVLVDRSSKITVRAVESIAQTMSTTVETLIKPVVDPEPIRQIDVPEQNEMLSEPEWGKDWNP